MKNLLIFLFYILCTTSVASQNVGINTENPRKTLEVGGDMNVVQRTTISEVMPLSDTDVATFLIQDTSNAIVTLDPKNPSGAALGYLQEYIIEDPNLDWVRDFDTGISATDFTLVIISAHFNRELALLNGDKDKFSLPYTSTFIAGGTWHIISDYPGVSNELDTANPVWEIQTLIFSKDLTKQFGVISVPMGGNTSNSATSSFID